MSKEMITIYRCNQCKTVLSNPEENIATSHLSIVIGAHSGWWEPTDIEISVKPTIKTTEWKNTGSINPGIYHFCSPIHFGKWLAEQYNKE